METKLRHAIGSTIGGYRVERVEPLEHLQGIYYELTHVPTGARHIHVEAPEVSKAFSVEFLTVPQDSRGVAHILEHVVLAGSERFPVRDPFFSMTSRSVRDFMNAMTSSDATMYPFSTRNAKDFHNLLEVYLDAVFFPKIEESSFLQEGHRFEFETIDDPTSPLTITGVVFNEMKASMASAARAAGQAIGRAVQPGSTYANNSGGDPLDIPDLTWQDLRDFHARHYHPSNALFFTYGDLPMGDVLGRIEELALSRFERIDPGVDIPDQPRHTEAVTLRDTYPLSRDEDPARRAQVFLSWLTAPMADTFQITALHILNEILLGNASSPLRKALIDSGIGEDLADVSYLRTSSKDAVFSAGLKGVAESDADRIEELVLATLEGLATAGIDPDQIDAALHQYEIFTREVSNEAFPYSLRVFFMLRAAYAYGGDPYRALRMDADFDRLRAEVAAGPFFEGLIRTHLLDNPHRASIVIAADHEHDDRRQAQEDERLAGISASLGDEDRRRIVDTALALKTEQEADQDLSSLPSLQPADVPIEDEDVPLHVETIHGATVALAPQPTNGLVYMALRADLSGVPDDLFDRLGLFAGTLSSVGAGSHDFAEQALRISRYTGGIQAAADVRTTPDGRDVRGYLVMRGKALARNTSQLVEILRDIMTALAYEPSRLRDVIAEDKADTEAALVPAGNRFADLLAQSRISAAAAFRERVSGLSNFAVLKQLAELEPSGLGPLIEELDALRGLVFRAGSLEICLTGTEDDLPALRDGVAGILESLPAEVPAASTSLAARTDATHPARTTSVPVSYNAKAMRTVPYDHPDAPALMVAGKYLRSFYLHREIREKGGAYGSMGRADTEHGTFSFWSYRDPHIVRTFEIFDAAVRHLLDDALDATKLDEAVLQALAEVDPLTSPDVKGRRRFFDDRSGYTTDVRRRFKEALISVGAEDLRRVAREHLEGAPASLGILGNADRIAEANTALGGIFEVKPA